VVAAESHDLLPDRLQPPPLGLKPKPRRVMVKEVSSAHREEVGGQLAPPASSPGYVGPGPRGQCQKAPLASKTKNYLPEPAVNLHLLPHRILNYNEIQIAAPRWLGFLAPRGGVTPPVTLSVRTR